MDKVIEELKRMKADHERAFLEGHVYLRTRESEGPVPDVSHNLDMIIELSDAIDILNKYAVEQSKHIN